MLAGFICRELLAENMGPMPKPDEPLIGPVIDSVGLHQLISFLESEFGIEVPDVEIVPENFATLSALASYVDRKRGG